MMRLLGERQSLFNIAENAMKKEMVIIGGGSTGVNLVKQLKNKKEFHITLVDKNNYTLI